MKRVVPVLVLLAAALATPITAWVAAEQPAPLRIFLRGGPKTHGPAGNGLHDHEVWVKDWTPLLTARGAKVDGGLQFPTGPQLDGTDVLVMFAANAGTILGEQRSNLERFLKRGGGIVVIHDALVAGQEPHWFKTIVGGAWENKVAKYFEGENTLLLRQHRAPDHQRRVELHDHRRGVLGPAHDAGHAGPGVIDAAGTSRPGETAPVQPAIGKLIPQVWVYENQLEGGQPYRAFVHLLGHHFSTFSSPHFRAVLLRGIAWAGKRDADSLVTTEELSALR